jgi:hypothetical protein
MKKVIRLTEKELTNLVKRIVNEQMEKNNFSDDILNLGDGSMLMGASSLMGGGKPTEMSMLDTAIQQLKIVVVLLNYLPETISMEEKNELEKLYNSYITNAFYMVRDDEEDTEELSHYVEKLKNHIRKTLSKKSGGMID